MINPAEIRLKAENKFKAYLQSIIRVESIFPLKIVGNKKPSKSLLEYKTEIEKLITESKDKMKYGYSITFEKRKTKTLGTQSFPVNIYFETENNFVKYLKKEKESILFKKLYIQVLSEYTELKDWIIKYPIKIIVNKDIWDDLLKVCRYFTGNPKPNMYIRELPIKVHTKFIENNKGIIKEILDIIISESVNFNENIFEKRFNLKFSESLIRLKILEPDLSNNYFSGVSDISLPSSQFNTLKIPITRVIVVENLMNLLTFPNQSNCIAIFGKGFQVSNLKHAKWLNTIEFLYWGDIDVQGFEILSQIRGYFKNVKSFLMDEFTFEKFFEEDNGTVSNVNIKINLTEDEYSLYKKVKENNWRLEQEKIPLNYLKEKIEHI